MAVTKRSYRAYNGELAPARWRFLVVTRYTFGQLMESKVFIGMLTMCLVPSFVGLLIIYLANTEMMRILLNIQINRSIEINARYFYGWLQFQGWIAVLVTAYVGPNLVSSDLMNNALPLYLSRPLSRAEYVLGKSMVLGTLLSGITWIPGLLMFLMQASMAQGWVGSNWRIAGAIVLGSWIWIAFLALVSLALSAWVRWRIVATGLTLAMFIIPAGMGETLNVAMKTQWGLLFNLIYVIQLIWSELFGDPMRWHLAYWDRQLPVWMAWGVLLACCGIAIWMLNVRLRAREVVRG